MSLPSSPLSLAHPGIPQRLSSRRRGSVTATDPWGTVPETDRGVASTLHILKAPYTVPQELDDKVHRRRSLREHVRTPSSGSNPSRISFANSAFARPSSPVRADPKGTSPSRKSSFAARTVPDSTLTPQQVYELAQQCHTHPQSLPSTPVGNALPSPANFTPLPDMHYLPFIDRPAEVQELLSTPGTRKLFLLLAQTFPNGDAPGEVNDPTSWSYAQLEHWLTTTTRDMADDKTWVQQAKMCVAGRSELIWERVKTALGVPPELDGEEYEDIVGPENPNGDDTSALDIDDTVESAWVDAIVVSPARSPSVCRSPVNSYFGRESPSLVRQLASRMEDISEDAPESNNHPASPVVQGLRVVNYPSQPATRRFSAPSTPISSSSSSHLPYDAVGERGPGNPLFPSTFANLALGPTLRANNPSLRSPPLPPDSAYPVCPGLSRPRRQTRSWAEGWNPQNYEDAVSAASGSSVGRGVVVE